MFGCTLFAGLFSFFFYGAWKVVASFVVFGFIAFVLCGTATSWPQLSALANTGARVPVFFRRTQFRCGQNRYRYHIWCMRVLVEPTFFWAFPEVWTCNGLFVYSPGLGCLCRPLTTRNLRIRHAQTWGGLLLPFVRLYVWPTTVISLYGGKECHFSMTASCA